MIVGAIDERPAEADRLPEVVRHRGEMLFDCLDGGYEVLGYPFANAFLFAAETSGPSLPTLRPFDFYSQLSFLALKLVKLGLVIGSPRSVDLLV